MNHKLLVGNNCFTLAIKEIKSESERNNNLKIIIISKKDRNDGWKNIINHLNKEFNYNIEIINYFNYKSISSNEIPENSYFILDNFDQITDPSTQTFKNLQKILTNKKSIALRYKSIKHLNGIICHLILNKFYKSKSQFYNKETKYEDLAMSILHGNPKNYYLFKKNLSIAQNLLLEKSDILNILNIKGDFMEISKNDFENKIYQFSNLEINYI